VSGTLPAGGFSEHWYVVSFAIDTQSPPGRFLPTFNLTSGLFDYVVDAFVSSTGFQPLQMCATQQAPVPELPALGITQWAGQNISIGFDPNTYPPLCAFPNTLVYLRVRPVSLNYQCVPFTLHLENDE
jgi:hypothetical protein